MTTIFAFIIALIVNSGLLFVVGQDCVCGVENQVSRIIGGTAVPEAKYPWMAYLFIFSPTGFQRCGGAIINDRYILTAAHCLADALSVMVGVGAIQPTANLTVAKFTKHPNYIKMPPMNDIALVKLNTPLIWSKKIRPICLPTQDMDQSGNLTVAGWGIKDDVTHETSNTLLEMTATENNFDDCMMEWHFLDRSSQFCAGSIGKASCKGDSGGPIWKRVNGRSYTLGAVSFAHGECASHLGTVYAKVSHYLNWIKENTADGIYCVN